MSSQWSEAVSSFGSDAPVSESKSLSVQDGLLWASHESDDRAPVRREAAARGSLRRKNWDNAVALSQLLAEMRMSAPFVGGPPGWT